jgi:hypothetical protein
MCNSFFNLCNQLGNRKERKMKRQFFIAGVQFRPRQEIDAATKLMSVGDILMLSREPSNKFDPNAVKIEFITEVADGSVIGTFLGYVPKKFSSEVSGMLSIDAPIVCIVDEVVPSGKTYEMIKVTVQIPVDEDTSEEEDNGEEEGPE